MSKRAQPWLPLIALPRGRYRLPRRYDQSASGSKLSFFTLPREKCSNLSTSDSLNSLPSSRAEGESILRMYPSCTPQDLAKSRFPAAESERKYDLSCSMDLLLPTGNQKASPALIPKGNLPFGKRGYASGMDPKICEIRRKRLKLLVAQLGTGGQTKAAGLIAERRGAEITPSYVNRMLMPMGKRGRKNISGDMATDIEKVFGKPHGWLSIDPADESRTGRILADQPVPKDWPFTIPPAAIGNLEAEKLSEIDRVVTQMVVDALLDQQKRAS